MLIEAQLKQDNSKTARSIRSGKQKTIGNMFEREEPVKEPILKESKDKYLNFDAGFRAVIKVIQDAGVRILESHELNMNRYAVTRTEDKTYLIAYKRDFFFSFGKIFEKEGETGVGESINVEDLSMALRKEITDLIFVYRNGGIYTISLESFMEHSYRRDTDAEGKAVRSVSIKHLKNFEDALDESINKANNESLKSMNQPKTESMGGEDDML